MSHVNEMGSIQDGIVLRKTWPIRAISRNATWGERLRLRGLAAGRVSVQLIRHCLNRAQAGRF
ncbi:MAG: hypothetical protein CMK99_17125 [Pseudomonas sp.]|nr:hypothetical protein [Pseudomonas sp.]HBS79480.1 hypothetical protein [Pseudomonas sp.]